MPIEYVVEPERRFVRIVASGEVGDGEIWPIVRDLFADPAYEPGFDVVVDASALTKLTVSNGEMLEVAQRIQTFEADHTSQRTALILPEISTVRRLVGTYVDARSNVRYAIRVFSDVDEGVAWAMGSGD